MENSDHTKTDETSDPEPVTIIDRITISVFSRCKLTWNREITWRERIKAYLWNRYKVIPKSMFLLIVWLLIEIVWCNVVLWKKEENYVDNFMNHICSENQCPGFLEFALRGRIWLSSIAIIGILLVKIC